jgi:CheY-like chemotaxis protein
MVPVLVVAMIVVFVIVNVVVRVVMDRRREAKVRKERLEALDIGLRLDFATEAPSLKRVEVPHPLARILAVDDEAIVLDSFRKILVAAGYSIDTVESGREALGLVQKHTYDFVFTDLKMPEMDGLDVVKGVKHYSPDTDVVVITGYATIESAVNAMKWGAMDYVQKPFTEEELAEFTKKCLYRRQDRQHKRLSSTVRVATTDRPPAHAFGLPGGVFISPGHVWANVTVPGLVRVGLDDFARKLIGRIDAVELPAKGATVKKGEPLFTVRQGARAAALRAPVSGTVHDLNADLPQHLDWLKSRPYEKGWVCAIEPAHLADELGQLRIGEAAAEWYHEEIERVQQMLGAAPTEESAAAVARSRGLVEGQLEEADDAAWAKFAQGFLQT